MDPVHFIYDEKNKAPVEANFCFTSAYDEKYI